MHDNLNIVIPKEIAFGTLASTVSTKAFKQPYKYLTKKKLNIQISEHDRTNKAAE